MSGCRYSTQGVAEWVERPLWSSNRGRRGGDILMGYVTLARRACHTLRSLDSRNRVCRYGYKRAMAGRTVVTQSYMDSQQHPRLPREDVVEYLNNSGIHRVMCGHQPFGDSPHVMRIPGKLDVRHGTRLPPRVFSSPPSFFFVLCVCVFICCVGVWVGWWVEAMGCCLVLSCVASPWLHDVTPHHARAVPGHHGRHQL